MDWGERKSRLRRLPGGETGQDLVEFALLLPVLLILVTGILDMGRAVGVYIDLTNVSREGARFAALHPSATTTAIQARAVAEAQACGLTDLGAGNVTITPTSRRTDGTIVTVQVTYPLPLITTLILNTGAIYLHGQTSMVVAGS